MASAALVMQWTAYAGSAATPALFAYRPLAFNSRQERLHQLVPGDRLWLVSRCHSDQQYYFVAVLTVAAHRRNSGDSDEARLYGEYAILADANRSLDLGTRFPAEGLLRALEFESGKPVRHGSQLGQSLQTIRFLTSEDERLLDATLAQFAQSRSPFVEFPYGLWTKCDITFAQYFADNWRARQQPLAFLLYDPPPALPHAAPVFIHSDKHLRLIGRFLRGEFIAGHRFTVDVPERNAERERIWATYRASTVNPPPKDEFDKFFDAQHGVRGLFVMDHVLELSSPLPFKEYARALGWGYPTGVGYRYLSRFQSAMLLRGASISPEAHSLFLQGLLPSPVRSSAEPLV